MSAEWIAKLTAKSIRITGEGVGGTAQVTWCDIAASLSGTNRLGYLLLLAKEIKKEKNCTINIALRVAVACSFSVINPMRCHNCHGRTVVFPKKKGKTILETFRKCSSCDGTGYRQLSERKKSDIAGIPSSTWHDSWKDYCNKKEGVLWMLEDDSIKHLRNNINKEVA